ncbi:Acylphosphatase-2 [Pseudolycoriella hygida]|uniref:acylphosphatase n=1 Tax=Pseudolycoriella hygida TaxID=35572 RepID=A0A9Q0NB63_9DIPT|nr:Acylphosphatase-2 [Pseudolycoriella hygida]
MGVAEDAALFLQVDFEVFGHVQGCYFTKFTRDMCVELNIRGWVKNSKNGTIVGKMQGTKPEIHKMVEWLSKEGSPGCKIERCELTNWGTLVRLDYKEFSIRF